MYLFCSYRNEAGLEGLYQAHCSQKRSRRLDEVWPEIALSASGLLEHTFLATKMGRHTPWGFIEQSFLAAKVSRQMPRGAFEQSFSATKNSRQMPRGVFEQSFSATKMGRQMPRGVFEQLFLATKNESADASAGRH